MSELYSSSLLPKSNKSAVGLLPEEQEIYDKLWWFAVNTRFQLKSPFGYDLRPVEDLALYIPLYEKLWNLKILANIHPLPGYNRRTPDEIERWIQEVSPVEHPWFRMVATE